MVKRENHCCGCATSGYPCIGSSCYLTNVLVTYCDECGEEIEGDIYDAEGEELCEDCLKEMFRRND